MAFRCMSGCLIGCLLFLPACSNEGGDTLAQTRAVCSFDTAVATSGMRKLALIVGVGEYLNDNVPDLQGPPNDARRIHDLLTADDGFGFPAENVCLLLDDQATTAGFLEAFEKGLVERVQEGDVAVIFFAGHGSQRKDANGDEPDEWDETLLLHDARVEGQRDLVDDELNGLLARLHERTRNVVLILDSCNSGTATRGDSGLVARFFQPDETAADDTGGSGDGDGAWGGAALPGLVAFTAASDGTPALERNGAGVFTNALLRALADGSDSPLTYAQVARQVAPLVAAQSYQIPYFQGDLQGPVFGTAGSRRALGWDVVRAGNTLELSGPPLPGIGVGAELDIFAGGTIGAPDPSNAKATAVITELSGINATARISTRVARADPVAVGDLAMLVRPGDEFLKISLKLRDAGRTGGIPAARAESIRRAIADHPEARMLVEVVSEAGEFELAVGFDGALELRGPENRVRNTIAADEEVPDVLWKHARQRALLQLRGEGGTDFVDNETLRARLVPAARQPACADGEWVQAAANEDQVVPLCHDWNVEVTLAQDAAKPLLIGALILSTDGSTFGLPRDARTVLLSPGETVVFRDSGETFRGTPPLDTRDQLLVFGTQERNPVPWNALTQTAGTRGPAPANAGTLHRMLDRYLRPGTRGSAPVEDAEPTTWTMSSIGMRVEANQRFLEPVAGTRSINTREYTIKLFDIRPYLPDDPDSALSTVLRMADSLARSSVADGYGYAQHDWSQGSDDANLRVGIDCSRSIWFAFTRSGLKYNRDDRYLTTADMVGENSWMADEFEQCPAGEDFELGDILVYRSSDPRKPPSGHVVMVIDAPKRIAWGSHGWDGGQLTPGVQPDTGVEYQLIKRKPDWQRWDRQDMTLRSCWRYRRFTMEASDGRGLPGAAALRDACDENVCRL